jgi:hypothetical protein
VIFAQKEIQRGRFIVLLTKEFGVNNHRSVVLDAVLLPVFAKGEHYFGTSLCVHKVPKAPAIAIVRASKGAYQVKSAWVIDREVAKILKVNPSAVKCEDDPGSTP